MTEVEMKEIESSESFPGLWLLLLIPFTAMGNTSGENTHMSTQTCGCTHAHTHINAHTHTLPVRS